MNSITDRLAATLRRIRDQHPATYAHNEADMLSDVREWAAEAVTEYDAVKGPLDSVPDNLRPIADRMADLLRQHRRVMPYSGYGHQCVGLRDATDATLAEYESQRAKENATSGFEYLPENRAPRFVSEEEARHLLRNHTRDITRALGSLRAHPYARLTCEGGEIRYVPQRQKPDAVLITREKFTAIRRALDFAVSRMYFDETERAMLRGIADVLLDAERAS